MKGKHVKFYTICAQLYLIATIGTLFMLHELHRAYDGFEEK